VILEGTTSENVCLRIMDLLYIEAVGNYVKVYHWTDGQVRSDMLRATMKQMEDDLAAYPTIVRSHRAFLVNLQQVEKIISRAGNMLLILKQGNGTIPVSRSNMGQIKDAVKSV
jgi:DNA-binding LytR/AlgR family response regulator